jgi:spermidine synthase
MPRTVWFSAALLFVSGACALVFQTAWFREFRLIFGASTPASAAVLAIFMGGLGLGNALVGRYADRVSHPLRLYAQLELAISLLAAISPWLVAVIRAVYVASGGQETLGLSGATAARLLGAALVLGPPTFLMGGTLPAAARAVVLPSEDGRQSIGWLYGLNTLGAVVGALVSTFWLLEQWGTHGTLWLACGMNLINALVAWQLSRYLAPVGSRAGTATSIEPMSKPSSSGPRADATTQANANEHSVAIPAWGWYGIAAAAGWAFFLMEMVWFRMLAPILGGTTFTFGLILAVALAGIGLGGALYPLLFRARRPTLGDFVLSLAAEALALAIPLAIGDRLAVLAAILRSLALYGFAGQAFGWLVVTSIVVFPAALVSGLQFPMLIALIGRGDRHVGKQVGLAFGWNTLGAMAGSLAGGFGLLALLSAPGVWRLVVLVLAALALVLLVRDVFARGVRSISLTGAALAALAVACLLAPGPSALWRHGGIGAGRIELPQPTQAALTAWNRAIRRSVVWEADGREAAVAITVQNGAAFLVNGKSDGNAIGDAGTQIMLGALGGLLHPEPRQGLVVGLGTGESAGWMASLPAMEQVEVIELEPSVLKMAQLCAPLNHHVLEHPRVRLVLNDARDHLQTTRQNYDLIASEPSNPYRTGVSSLYTREFYATVKTRLRPGGLFLQWLQAYEVDPETVRTVLATLATSFSHVEIWQTELGDFVLVCSAEPLKYTADDLRARMSQPAMAKALAVGWRTTSLAGVLSHFVASAEYTRQIAADSAVAINTDDRNRLEYAFARTVGRELGFVTTVVHGEAVRGGWNRPSQLAADIDWREVTELRLVRLAADPRSGGGVGEIGGELGQRLSAMLAARAGDYESAARFWGEPAEPPSDHLERLWLALARAESAHPQTAESIQQISATSPLEAAALAAILAVRQDRHREAAALLGRLFESLQSDPTILEIIGDRALRAGAELCDAHPEHAPRIYEALRQPLAVFLLEARRIETLWLVGRHVGPQEMAAAVALLEPYPPWNAPILETRVAAYERVRHPLLETARRELAEFRRQSPPLEVLRPSGSPAKEP